MHFADLVWLREALLAARPGQVVHRATKHIIIIKLHLQFRYLHLVYFLIHDVNPSQLSGAFYRCRCEKHYWMRGATQ